MTKILRVLNAYMAKMRRALRGYTVNLRRDFYDFRRTKLSPFLKACMTNTRRVFNDYVAANLPPVLKDGMTNVSRFLLDYRQALGETAVTVCLIGVAGWLAITAFSQPAAVVVRDKVACIVGTMEVYQHKSIDTTVVEAVKMVNVGCDNGWFFTARDEGTRFGLTEPQWNDLRQGSVVVATHWHRGGGIFTRSSDYLTNGDVWDIKLPLPRPTTLDGGYG